MTGVQTCALPILISRVLLNPKKKREITKSVDRLLSNSVRVFFLGMTTPDEAEAARATTAVMFLDVVTMAARGQRRSEERRGGKEGRNRWSPEH